MCLHCGKVRCGRYVNAHALAHSEQHSHTVCIDCENFSVFWCVPEFCIQCYFNVGKICVIMPQLVGILIITITIIVLGITIIVLPCCSYACNDYIVNDTASGSIARIRELLQITSSDTQTQWPTNCEIGDSGSVGTRRNLRPRNRKRYRMWTDFTWIQSVSYVDQLKPHPLMRTPLILGLKKYHLFFLDLTQTTAAVQEVQRMFRSADGRRDAEGKLSWVLAIIGKTTGKEKNASLVWEI